MSIKNLLKFVKNYLSLLTESNHEQFLVLVPLFSWIILFSCFLMTHCITNFEKRFKIQKIKYFRNAYILEKNYINGFHNHLYIRFHRQFLITKFCFWLVKGTTSRFLLLFGKRSHKNNFGKFWKISFSNDLWCLSYVKLNLWRCLYTTCCSQRMNEFSFTFFRSGHKQHWRN